jgi:dienelactone hydrolase
MPPPAAASNPLLARRVLLGALSLTALVGVALLAKSPQARADPVTNAGASAGFAFERTAAERYDTHYLEWTDPARADRLVRAKLYVPAGTMAPAGKADLPLVVFSHGIGGSREGYSYLGSHWAAHGMAALHLQHVGSDRSVWQGSPLGLLFRLQNAAREDEAIDRARDVSFALDQLLRPSAAWANTIDRHRIAMAGHSYGANTALLVAGATVSRDGAPFSLRDERVRAAIVLSVPPFYGLGSPEPILRPVRIPTLHITATGDEIKIPGYNSGVEDRLKVFNAMASPKALAVFKDGSHSIFTDRMGTGGADWNPRVKAATRDLSLAFLEKIFFNRPAGVERWAQQHQGMLARFERAM